MGGGGGSCKSVMISIEFLWPLSDVLDKSVPGNDLSWALPSQSWWPWPILKVMSVICVPSLYVGHLNIFLIVLQVVCMELLRWCSWVCVCASSVYIVVSNCFFFFLWHFLHLGLCLFYIQNEDRWLVAPVLVQWLLVQQAWLLKAELGCKWCGGGVSSLRRGEDDQENCRQKHTGLLLPPFRSHLFYRSTYRVTSFWTWLHSVELGHFDVLYEMLEVWDVS